MHCLCDVGRVPPPLHAGPPIRTGRIRIPPLGVGGFTETVTAKCPALCVSSVHGNKCSHCFRRVLKGLGLNPQQVTREVRVSKPVSMTGMRVWHVGLALWAVGLVRVPGGEG